MTARHLVLSLVEADMERVCMYCVQGDEVPQGARPAQSHGLCKRHAIAHLKAEGLEDHEVAKLIRDKPAHLFCPDLGRN